MITVKTREISELTQQLGKFAKRAVPFATMQTMNDAAFTARRRSVEIIKETMILRNRFTLASLRIDKATRSNPASTFGSVEPFMATQEFGGRKVTKGKEGTPLATGFASGEGRIGRSRRRLPTRKKKLTNINLNKKGVRGTSLQQKLLIKMRNAIKTGNRDIYLELRSGTKGIFRVVGGRKNEKSKRGFIKGARLEMIHNLSMRTVNTPQSPWLRPSIIYTNRRMKDMFTTRLKQQVKRQKLFLQRKATGL